MAGSCDLEDKFGYRNINLDRRLCTVETTVIKTYKNTQKFSFPTSLCVFRFQSGSVIHSIQHNHFAIAMPLYFFLSRSVILNIKVQI